MDQLALEGIPQTRQDRDQFFTPPWLAEKMADWAMDAYRRDHMNDAVIQAPLVLEPGAGQGSIIAALFEQQFGTIIAYETDKNHAKTLTEHLQHGIAQGRLLVRCRDFLLADPPGNQLYDLAVMNPPYSADVAFVAKALRLSHRVIALLRSTFFNGVANWGSVWSKYRLCRVAHLRRRPKFGGRFTPQIDFSVFDISHGETQMVQTRWW